MLRVIEVIGCGCDKYHYNYRVIARCVLGGDGVVAKGDGSYAVISFCEQYKRGDRTVGLVHVKLYRSQSMAIRSLVEMNVFGCSVVCKGLDHHGVRRIKRGKTPADISSAEQKV